MNAYMRPLPAYRKRIPAPCDTMCVRAQGARATQRLHTSACNVDFDAKPITMPAIIRSCLHLWMRCDFPLILEAILAGVLIAIPRNQIILRLAALSDRHVF